ncbi:MAG: hypothetical protein HYT29_01985 [Parcubacteria group bacterium]|nr:hypothetical protein [Parcubacteria group bacterium]
MATVWTAVAIASFVSWAYANVIFIPPFIATLMLAAAPFWYLVSYMHAREERKEKETREKRLAR